MWRTVYYSRNELCLLRMELFLSYFFIILLRIYIIVTCNLCQQIDGKGIHTSNSRTSEKLFILLYIYYCIFLGGGEGVEVGGIYLTIYVPSEKETVT